MIYGVDMLLRQLDEDEEAAAVFDRYAPGLRARAGQAGEGGGLSIRQIARYTHGMIPDESLEKMDAELKAVGKRNGGISPAERQRMEGYRRIAAADAAREDVPETFENTAIHPGKVWLDTRGRRIQAHAGGIFYEDGVYYWYGENKEHTDGKSLIWTWGIRMYASKDLYNWSDCGLIIPPVLDDPNSDLFPEQRVDRPHIIKNRKTGKYVCWIKLSGPTASFTVLTADCLAGPYTLVREKYNPFGLNIGDFDIAADETAGKAYLYCEAEHEMVVGIRLDEEYTSAEEIVSRQYGHLLPPFCREGVTVFERKGRLYMLTSGMSGYVPNQSDAAVSSGYEEPFVSVGDPHVEDDSLSSFNSQIGQVFRIPGRDLYITLADRWVPDYVVDRQRALSLRRAIASSQAPDQCSASEEDKRELMASPGLDDTDTSRADYVWLPVTFENDLPRIRWQKEWRAEDYLAAEPEEK